MMNERMRQKVAARRAHMQRIHSEDAEVLCGLLQFLASADEAKVRYLPPRNADVIYVINECGNRTGNPLLFLSCASCELIGRYTRRNRDESNVLSEIAALLETMIQSRETGVFEAWSSDTSKNLGEMLCTRNVRLWALLRRLASLALVERGWPEAAPEVALAEINWEGIRIRKERSV